MPVGICRELHESVLSHFLTESQELRVPHAQRKIIHALEQPDGRNGHLDAGCSVRSDIGDVDREPGVAPICPSIRLARVELVLSVMLEEDVVREHVALHEIDREFDRCVAWCEIPTGFDVGVVRKDGQDDGEAQRSGRDRGDNLCRSISRWRRRQLRRSFHKAKVGSAKAKLENSVLEPPDRVVR
ncbi:MAG: hypothetical protein ACRDHC_01915, partial [Actinomycetota bacterium]